MTQPPKLTDRKALSLHRARVRGDATLHDLAAVEIEERLADINKSFTKTAIVGLATSALRQRFPEARFADDGELLNLEPQSYELVVHSFGLHWADDPVGQMVQSRLALKPDGLFVGVLFAGQTLSELRTVLAETETKIFGGLSPRVAPLSDVRALGDLLFRAGLALPVADSITVRQRYTALPDLIEDLRKHGETNALASRRSTYLPRSFWHEAEALYHEHFSKDGLLAATFELVFLTGWAPHENQQKPLKPGSATQRLAEALGVPELRSGDTPRPKGR